MKSSFLIKSIWLFIKGSVTRIAEIGAGGLVTIGFVVVIERVSWFDMPIWVSTVLSITLFTGYLYICHRLLSQCRKNDNRD